MSDNPNHPSYRQIIRPNDISADMDFSILLSRSLDVLGYNQDMIRHRVDFWKLFESLGNINHAFACDLINAGSQAEGVVALFGSDTDAMSVDNNVICADNIQPFIDHRNITLFQTDSRDTEAGYTKLKLIKLGNGGSVIDKSLIQSINYKTKYISSELFSNSFLVTLQEVDKSVIPRSVTLTKAGPAIPVYDPTRPDVVHDLVYCFKCYCPFQLQSWLRRPRRYNWPSPDNMYYISQMEAHVVPVGCKSSDTYYQEWRICFTKAEIYLIHSLNNAQIKLYVILKMIIKAILKNICPEITSYIIKNIVLWMCESLPSENFTEHQLVNIIIQALAFLKTCVAQNYLPSYMIPERNLFYGRIEQGQKCELIECLSSFIEEGPAVLFHRLETICGAMSLLYQEPQKAELCMIKRNTVEKLNLLKILRWVLITQPDMTEEESDQVILQDELRMNITRALLNLVVPEWKNIPNARDIYNARMSHILS